MLRAVLIDDEKNSLESLEIEIIDNCPGVTIVELCNGAKAGIASIIKNEPDLIFLDIDMPVMNGFEMLEHVKHIPFEIIFTTAYEEFVLKAIKVSAMDYLLKPIDPVELQKAVQRVIEKHSTGFSKNQLDVLLTNIQSTQTGFQKLAIPSLNGLDFVDVQDIIYCKADSSYTTIFTKSGEKHIISRTLKETEELLGGSGFFRTHQSYLVNLSCIKRYIKGAGGQLVLKDGTVVYVARARKEALMQIIYQK